MEIEFSFYYNSIGKYINFNHMFAFKTQIRRKSGISNKGKSTVEGFLKPIETWSDARADVDRL